MLTIEKCTHAQAQNFIEDLIALLQDGVGSGASIGFLPPLSDEEARAYWQGIIDDVAHGKRVLLVALFDGALVGSVQLELAMKPNARHRAEVQKLIVFRKARRQGIGRALMSAVEQEAQQLGRKLLVLDTLAGDAAEPLYRQQGYTEVGRIPYFASSAGGELYPTVIFYRWLGE
jgi:GNAT superfamily N-acetyltransferase